MQGMSIYSSPCIKIRRTPRDRQVALSVHDILRVFHDNLRSVYDILENPVNVYSCSSLDIYTFQHARPRVHRYAAWRMSIQLETSNPCIHKNNRKTLTFPEISFII